MAVVCLRFVFVSWVRLSFVECGLFLSTVMSGGTKSSQAQPNAELGGIARESGRKPEVLLQCFGRGPPHPAHLAHTPSFSGKLITPKKKGEEEEEEEEEEETAAATPTTTTTATAREDDEGEEEVRKHLKPFLVAFEHSLRELRKDVELVPTGAQQDAEDYAIDSLQVLKDLKKKGEETFETNKRMRKEYLVIKEKSIKTMDLLSRM